MSENKSTALRSWGLGELKITEWEKNAKYLQYSINKTEYEKPKNQCEKGIYRSIFTISTNRKEELVIIYNLLKRRGKTETFFGAYSLKPQMENNNNHHSVKYLLTRTYEDYKTNETKEQRGTMNIFEILLLEELLKTVIDEAIIARYRRQNNGYGYDNYSDNHNMPEDNSDNRENDGGNFIDGALDDDIPF
jgi:hypothetical protein